MINRKFNVLIFPAGSEIGLELHNSLKYNLHVELFGVSGKADHARFVYNASRYEEGNYYITENDFVDKFNEVLIRFNIDFIFPTHDSIVLFLAENQALLKAKVITSSDSVARIAREKKLTYEKLRSYSFCPRVYSTPFAEVRFPVFLKPNIGQGGKGTILANSLDELTVLLHKNSDLIPCEYLPGEELSVDCFSNRHGELLFIGPRVRYRVEMGISFNTFSVSLTNEIREIAETLHKEFNFRGAWFFQVKKDKSGKFKLLEFAPRHSSTMGLFRQAGVNFALLSIFDAAGEDVGVIANDYSVELDRCLCNSYKLSIVYKSVYIDFDDTIIVNNKVNDVALRFLYQCKNKNIETILLTKHKFDLQKSLDDFCLSTRLFNKIIHINEQDDKVNWIDPNNAIFIDNYFFDRKTVKEKFGIPVFDVDAIEGLLI